MKIKLLVIAFFVLGVCSCSDPSADVPQSFDPSGVYTGQQIELAGSKVYTLAAGVIRFEVSRLGDNQIKVVQVGDINADDWQNGSGTYTIELDRDGGRWRGVNSGIVLSPGVFSFRRGYSEIVATK